ncbi:MAG: hypothetical protein ABI553_03775 [Chloroflexota bacterium]
MAAIGAVLMVIGCILPWWQVGGTPGITARSGTGLEGSAIFVFLVGIVTLALVVLPYASGDRPVALDRWLSFAILTIAGWIGFGWRIIELTMVGAFQFGSPAQILTNGPGLWLAAIGLAIHARAVYSMTRESAYR